MLLMLLGTCLAILLAGPAVSAVHALESETQAQLMPASDSQLLPALASSTPSSLQPSPRSDSASASASASSPFARHLLTDDEMEEKKEGEPPKQEQACSSEPRKSVKRERGDGTRDATALEIKLYAGAQRALPANKRRSTRDAGPKDPGSAIKYWDAQELRAQNDAIEDQAKDALATAAYEAGFFVLNDDGTPARVLIMNEQGRLVPKLDAEGLQLYMVDVKAFKRALGGSLHSCAFRMLDTTMFRRKDREEQIQREVTPSNFVPGGVPFIALVPLSTEAARQLREHRLDPWKSPGAAASHDDSRALHHWVLADHRPGWVPVVGDECPKDFTYLDPQVLPTAYYRRVKNAQKVAGKADPNFVPAAKNGGKAPATRRELRPFSPPFVNPPASRRILFDGLDGKAVVTQIHPSGSFATCVLYKVQMLAAEDPADGPGDDEAEEELDAKQEREANDATDDGQVDEDDDVPGTLGASSGPAAAPAAAVLDLPPRGVPSSHVPCGQYLRTKGGRWVTGALRGELPFRGAPCWRQIDQQCPNAYSAGVQDTFYQEADFDELEFEAGELRHVVQPDDFGGRPRTPKGAYSPSGPLDWPGKPRLEVDVAGKVSKLRTWETVAANKFEFDTAFHTVSTSQLSIDTLRNFAGMRERIGITQESLIGASANDVGTALLRRLERNIGPFDDDRGALVRGPNGVYAKSVDIKARTGFEWTHLLGFSLGGAEKIGTVDTGAVVPPLVDPAMFTKNRAKGTRGVEPTTSPQLASNLVLGSWTVNSHMYQAETFLAALLESQDADTYAREEETDSYPLTAKVSPLLRKSRHGGGGIEYAPDPPEVQAAAAWTQGPFVRRDGGEGCDGPDGDDGDSESGSGIGSDGDSDGDSDGGYTSDDEDEAGDGDTDVEPPKDSSWPTWLGGRIHYTAGSLPAFGDMTQQFDTWSQYIPTTAECEAGLFLARNPPLANPEDLLEEEGYAGDSSDSASDSESSDDGYESDDDACMYTGGSDDVGVDEKRGTTTQSFSLRPGYQRRLLQLPQSQPSSQALSSQLSTASVPILQRLLPSIRDSPLADFLFDRVTISEGFIYWPEFGRERVQPSLHVNGSFSLDRYPFNQLGLKGAIDVQVQVSPWFGSQFTRILQPAQPLNILMRADYPVDADFGGGVTLSNVFVAVAYSPRARAPAVIRYTVGGAMEFDIPGQDFPLTLDASVSMQAGVKGVALEATVRNWVGAFGLDWLTMQRVHVTALLGLPSTYFRITSQWKVAGKTLEVEGVKNGNFIGGGVQVYDFTADDCASIFREAFGGSVAPSEVDVVFNSAFIGVANGEGYVLGYPLQKGITIHTNMDIWKFKGIDILLSIGSDGFHFRGEVPSIPDSVLPSSLHIGNITLEVLIPSSSAPKSRSSFFISLDVTYGMLQARGAFFIASKPTETLLIASAGPFSLSSLIPGLPSVLDITFEKLCLAYLSRSTIPNIPVIYEKFPELVNARIPPLNAPGSSVFIGALISRLGLLDEIFGMDSMKIQMMLSLIIGKTTAIGVNIMVTDVSLGPFKGGSLEFLAILSTPPVMKFTMLIYLDLPNAETRAEMAVALAIADTLFLSGSLGPANGDVNGPPVWPRPFGLPGLDVYYLGVGFKVIPVAIAVAFKIAFTKTSGQKIVLGGAVSLGADASNQLLAVEATNINTCVYFGMLDAVIGGAFGGVATAVDQVCSMFAFVQLDILEVNFSPKGAMIGALIFPPGMSLNAEVSLFGQKLLKSKGAIELDKMRAQFDASIAAIDLLGIIELKGKRGKNVTFGFVVAPGEISIYADAKLSLFKGLRKIGVYLQFGPGLLDFEFELDLYKALQLQIGVHIEFPVPKLPPLNPQAYLNAGAIVGGDAAGAVNLDPFKDFINSFDLSKFKFALSVGVDSQLLRDLFGMIVQDCLPDMQIFVEAAEAAFAAATEVYEQAKRAAEAVYQGAQQAAMAAYNGALQMAEEVAKLIEQAEQAVKMAEQGVQQAAEYATKFAAEAEQRALETFEASKQLLASTTEVWNNAKDASVKALTDATQAVSDFADKISGGFFNSLLSIFEYHRETNTLHWHNEYQRLAAARRIERDFAQSKSETQSMPVHSRKLLGFWDLETVFDGIVGALSFIQDKLNEAVDFAEDAIEIVKETAEQQVAAATEFVEEAGAAIEGAVQAGLDGADSIRKGAQDALDQAIKFADGEIIQKAIDAANAAKDFAVNAANAAKDALESAILDAKKIYDQAATFFSDATAELIKWIEYLGKGFGNLFEFEYFRFLGDFKKFSKDGILVFEFKVSIWDGAATFEKKVVIDFGRIVEFITKIEDFIFSLPALNICKLLK